MDNNFHDAIFIDGLNISNFSRKIFEDMLKGGITAANCTCCVWDGFSETMGNISQWKLWFEEHSDLIMQVYNTEDILAAKSQNKVGIILGWQNTSGIEDDVRYLALFRELGVRIIQLTYNSQNLVGSGCWETNDSGLSDFGRHAIDEMNRLGILIDLSHVGPKTSSDAIQHSKKNIIHSLTTKTV